MYLKYKHPWAKQHHLPVCGAEAQWRTTLILGEHNHVDCHSAHIYYCHGNSKLKIKISFLRDMYIIGLYLCVHAV